MSEPVQIDDVGVTRRLDNGEVEHVRWDALHQVAIVTTDEGPVAEDVFFVLEAIDGTGCVISQEAAHRVGLLERLQRLPGFDNAQLIDAMGSTGHARFVVWRTPTA